MALSFGVWALGKSIRLTLNPRPSKYKVKDSSMGDKFGLSGVERGFTRLRTQDLARCIRGSGFRV